MGMFYSLCSGDVWYGLGGFRNPARSGLDGGEVCGVRGRVFANERANGFLTRQTGRAFRGEQRAPRRDRIGRVGGGAGVGSLVDRVGAGCRFWFGFRGR
uniref:Uncharacterized protein n=1 Tax=uncultured marine virus TaxID=186617 RepID=A0A0F7L753_9VIRU|nr:hypothetical protein [uncultured marine virus]